MWALSLFLVGLPALVYAIPLFLIYILWGNKSTAKRMGTAWTFELDSRSWFYRRFYQNWGGTTFGNAIMFAPDPGHSVVVHELHHVKQFSAQSLCGNMLGMILAYLGHWELGMLVWLTLPGLCYLCGGIMAVINGDPFYTGNVFEIGAYSVGREAGGRYE